MERVYVPPAEPPPLEHDTWGAPHPKAAVAGPPARTAGFDPNQPLIPADNCIPTYSGRSPRTRLTSGDNSKALDDSTGIRLSIAVYGFSLSRWSLRRSGERTRHRWLMLPPSGHAPC
jgi:hypothetical protein